jgi:membrane-bound lytic murein transglycosylase D
MAGIVAIFHCFCKAIYYKGLAAEANNSLCLSQPGLSITLTPSFAEGWIDAMPKNYRIFNKILAVLLLLTLTARAFADPADFPIPANIRPAVDFWKKVYTQVDTQHGYLHDSVDLTIIYEILPRDSKLIDAQRSKIVSDLKVLATGKREGLSNSQQRILALWDGKGSNARFEQAAGTVRWQLGQSDRYREGLVRSGAYRKHIEAVLREKGMPIELAALPHVESSFHPGAFSSAAASGMWQFMRETAQRFMQVDTVVDERLDPYKATYAASELLKSDHRALGSWPLALTAYNHGANGIARAVRDTGSNDIGRIISDYKGPRFGFASRNFYPTFLAALEVEREEFQHFGTLQLDPAPEFVEYQLPAFVDAGVLAARLGISAADLKRDNPALLPQIWNGNKRIPKGYTLKINRAAFNGDLVASVRGLPSGELYNSQIADLSYTVRSGDSLSVIASRYKTSISELVAINQLRDRNSIRVGQKLILPQQDGSVPTLTVAASETRAPAVAAPTPQAIPASGQYEVRRGDTLSTIAARFKVAPATLMALNSLRNENLIHPGQMLRLGTGEVTAQAVAVQQANAQAVEVDATTVAREAVVQAENTLAADVADYRVAADNTIEILTDETMGHYATWLGTTSVALRNLNQLRASAAVRVGDRFKLDFSKVDRAGFEAKRKQYHGDLQTQYFASYRIRDTESYSIKRSEVLGSLASARSIPMWLFRQYNPDVNASRVREGQIVVFPIVEKVTN